MDQVLPSAKPQGREPRTTPWSPSQPKGDDHHWVILRIVFFLEATIVDTYGYLVIFLPGFLTLYARQRIADHLPSGTAPWDLQFFAMVHFFLVEAIILRNQRELLVDTGPFQFRIVDAELFSRLIHDGIAITARFFWGFPFHLHTTMLDLFFPDLAFSLRRDYKQLLKNKQPIRHETPYRYTSLSGPRSIRVLVLEALSGHSSHQDVRCHMEEQYLDANKPFTALSYAWDSYEGTADIICDGRVIQVSKNCAAALRQLQKTCINERLWVDAICINQSDAAEKKVQIGIMGEIYVKAQLVRAWLGEHNKSSKLVFDFLTDLSKPRRHQGAPTGIKVARRWPDLSKSLVEFFGRSWFTRAWPIQEVALPLPGRVKVVCGTDTMDFENIRLGWEWLSDFGLLPMAINLDQAVALQFYLADALALKRNGATSENRRLPNHRTLITDLFAFSFTAVMHAMRFKSCRDAKDKFFALYGVFQELGIDHGIPISAWDKTDAEVFEDVARACIKLDGLAVLGRAQASPGPYYELDDARKSMRRTRQNPYDSFLAAISAMACRTATATQNIKEGRGIDNVAEKWQTELPSWAPDWTQLPSANLDGSDDIKLVDSYSSTGERRRHRNSPDTHKIDLLLFNAFGEWKFGLKLFPLSSEPESDMAPSGPSHTNSSVASMLYHGCMPSGGKASLLKMTVRFIGETTAVGSVDSVLLGFQLSPSAWPSLSANSFKEFLTNLLRPAPDPAFSALIESACNFIWKSHMAQILISLRMALRTMHLDDTSLLSYFCVGAGVVYLRPRIHEVICMRYHTIAACPTNGYQMRSDAGRAKYPEFGELQEWNTLIAAWFMSPWRSDRTSLSWDRWYDMTSRLLLLVALLLWDLRDSVAPMTFGTYLYEQHWWLVGPLYVRFLAALMQQGARMGGDSVTFLLGQAVTSLTSIALAVGLLMHWTFAPFAAVFAVRASRRPEEFLMQLFGLDTRYRPANTYTPGMHFFATDTGITGSTSAPVRKGDCLVVADGFVGVLILRAGQRGYRVVGSAYVGNRTLEEMKWSRDGWKFWVGVTIE